MSYFLLITKHVSAQLKAATTFFVNAFLLLLAVQLKETIEKVRAGDKICLDIILIIIIIGIIGLIIKIAKGM